MSNSKRRGIVRNAVKLSLESREGTSTFDPSRFGEIEISPELRAKWLSVGLARTSQASIHAANHAPQESARRWTPSRRPWSFRALAWVGGLILLMALMAATVWKLMS